MKQHGIVTLVKERANGYVLGLEEDKFNLYSGWGKPKVEVGQEIEFEYTEKTSTDGEKVFKNIQKIEIINTPLETNEDKVIAFAGLSLLELAKKLSKLDTKATQTFKNGNGYDALVYLR